MAYTPPDAGSVLLDLGKPPQADPLNLALELDGDRSVGLAAVAGDAVGAFSVTALAPPAVAVLAAVAEDASGALSVNVERLDGQFAATTEDAAAAFAVVAGSGIYRPDVCVGVTASYGKTTGLPAQVTAAWSQNQRPFAHAQASWGFSPLVAVRQQAGWETWPAIAAQVSGGYGMADRLSGEAAGSWRYPPTVPAQANVSWNAAPAITGMAGSVWNVPPRVTSPCAASWNAAFALAVQAQARHDAGKLLWKAFACRWRKGIWPEGFLRFVPTPVIPPPTPPEEQSIRLDFREPVRTGPPIRLDFASHARTPHLIWIGDTAIVDTIITTTRVSDDAPFDLVSMRISRDITQFDWEITGEIGDAASLALLRPVNANPQEIAVDINGFEWRFLALFCGGSRRFADSSGQLQGRSKASQLSSPYFPTRSYSNGTTKTASQVCDDELQYTGFSMAYHPSLLTLMTQNWFFPPGAYSYQDRARIESVGLVAAAIDAQLYADRVDSVLHIAPKYPGLPRDWGSLAPDVVLENDFVSIPGESLENRPVWDQVIVSGQGVGAVRSVVRLAGTAGNVNAPDVVDPLITHPLAGRQRGLSVLASAGKQVRVSLEDIPLVSQIGVIEPGMLVEVRESAETWRGLCISTTIEAAFAKAVQHIELERHYP